MTRRDYVLLSTALHRAYVNQPMGPARIGILSAAAHIGNDISLRSSGFDQGRFMQDVVAGHTA